MNEEFRNEWTWFKIGLTVGILLTWFLTLLFISCSDSKTDIEDTFYMADGTFVALEELSCV